MPRLGRPSSARPSRLQTVHQGTGMQAIAGKGGVQRQQFGSQLAPSDDDNASLSVRKVVAYHAPG
jgi:hypothetical protein